MGLSPGRVSVKSHLRKDDSGLTRVKNYMRLQDLLKGRSLADRTTPAMPGRSAVDRLRFQGAPPAGKERRLPKSAVAELRKKIDTEGGFTYHAPSGSYPDSGVPVGLPEHGQVIPKADLTDEALERFAADRWELLQEEGRHLGGWLDTETDQVWLDVSDLHTDLDEALEEARSRGELAVYDLGKGEVRVPYSERPPSGPAHDQWDTDAVLKTRRKSR